MFVPIFKWKKNIFSVMYNGIYYIHADGGREAQYLQSSVLQVGLRYGFCFKLTLSSWVNLKQVTAQLCVDNIFPEAHITSDSL